MLKEKFLMSILDKRDSMRKMVPKYSSNERSFLTAVNSKKSPKTDCSVITKLHHSSMQPVRIFQSKWLEFRRSYAFFSDAIKFRAWCCQNSTLSKNVFFFAK